MWANTPNSTKKNSQKYICKNTLQNKLNNWQWCLLYPFLWCLLMLCIISPDAVHRKTSIIQNGVIGRILEAKLRMLSIHLFSILRAFDQKHMEPSCRRHGFACLPWYPLREGSLDVFKPWMLSLFVRSSIFTVSLFIAVHIHNLWITVIVFYIHSSTASPPPIPLRFRLVFPALDLGNLWVWIAPSWYLQF